MTISAEMQADLVQKLRDAPAAAVRRAALLAWRRGVTPGDIEMLAGRANAWIYVMVEPDMSDADRAARAEALARISRAEHDDCVAEAQRISDGPLAAVSGEGKTARLVC